VAVLEVAVLEVAVSEVTCRYYMIKDVSRAGSRFDAI